MAHYAYIDDNNIVTEVIVGPDEGTEPEGVFSWEDYFTAKGRGRVLRTSYNTRNGKHVDGGPGFRKNYAGIGFTYDEDKDAFIPPKPHESWVLNPFGFYWQAPISKPDDGGVYEWDESEGDWLEVVSETT